MISRRMSLPQLGLIASTRAMAGAGLGLLLADRLSDEQRRAVGWTLLAVGALTTIPLVAQFVADHDEATQPADEEVFAHA
jgi:uncharacterized membrane protein YfcA